MIPIGPQYVYELSPDAAALAAAQKLAKSKRLSHAASNHASWGRFRDDRGKSHAVAIDVRRDFRWRCDCGGGKEPCVHALALALRRAESTKYTDEEPEFVAEWLAERADLAPKQPSYIQQQPGCSVRRTAKRDARVAEGLTLVQEKLEDVYRLGLNSSVVNCKEFWDDFARMATNIQASGLVRFIADAPELLARGDQGRDELLTRLGRLEILVEAARRVDSFDDDFAAEIRQALGYTVSQRDVLNFGERVEGHWLALGWNMWSPKKKVWNAREWYYGIDSGRFATIQHTTQTQGRYERPDFNAMTELGTFYEGAMRFYPGAFRYRAISESSLSPISSAVFCRAKTTLDSFFKRLPRVYALAPWTSYVPALVDDVVVRPMRRRGENSSEYEWRVVSRSGFSAPLRSEGANGTNGARKPQLELYYCKTWDAPRTMFAEWNGREFEILTMWQNARLVTNDWD